MWRLLIAEYRYYRNQILKTRQYTFVATLRHLLLYNICHLGWSEWQWLSIFGSYWPAMLHLSSFFIVLIKTAG